MQWLRVHNIITNIFVILEEMKIGIVCYPTFGGSGVVATELGKALASNGHEIHFITYSQPARLDFFFRELILSRGRHLAISVV